MFENTDGRRTTDTGVTGILGELITNMQSNNTRFKIEMSSAEYLCKQVRARSSPTKLQA